MSKIYFQNGADGPEVALNEEGDSSSGGKRQLKDLADKYGTVEGAAAWYEGDEKPKHLEVDEAAAAQAVPESSRLKEHVITAPPSPDAEAEAVAATEAAAAAQAEAEAIAKAENEAAHAKAAADAEAAKKAEGKKKSDG